MKIDDLAVCLARNKEKNVYFILPGYATIPIHFHLTELGRVQKDFIDCGGNVRQVVTCTLQLWVADDTDHRLTADKFYKIILAGAKLISGDLQVEVEYQQESLTVFKLDHVHVQDNSIEIYLAPKLTACLAPDRCGVTVK